MALAVVDPGVGGGWLLLRAAAAPATAASARDAARSAAAPARARPSRIVEPVAGQPQTHQVQVVFGGEAGAALPGELTGARVEIGHVGAVLPVAYGADPEPQPGDGGEDGADPGEPCNELVTQAET